MKRRRRIRRNVEIAAIRRRLAFLRSVQASLKGSRR
jgi:hypothetical protein